MRFRLNSVGKHTRKISIDIDVQKPDEQFIQLIAPSPPKLNTIIRQTCEALKKGKTPILCEEGVGGTYFMFDDSDKCLGVFKPQDEEPYMLNNPKGLIRQGCDVAYKGGILVGEAAVRECAAYLLDHDHFAGVPQTDLAIAQHNSFNGDSGVINIGNVSPKLKVGSFQEFKDHDGDVDDISPSMAARFAVAEVHKIAVLDIRLFNTDRHGGNILKQNVMNADGDQTTVLIPIDHGYCFPATMDEAWFEWLRWGQTKIKMDEKTKEYIRNLDAEKDVEILKQKFYPTIREEHFKVLRISTSLLKKGAEADLSLFQIADMMCRSNINKPSVLEQLCSEAEKRAEQGDKSFFEHLSVLVDDKIKEILEQNKKDQPSANQHTSREGGSGGSGMRNASYSDEDDDNDEDDSDDESCNANSSFDNATGDNHCQYNFDDF